MYTNDGKIWVKIIVEELDLRDTPFHSFSFTVQREINSRRTREKRDKNRSGKARYV